MLAGDVAANATAAGEAKRIHNPSRRYIRHRREIQAQRPRPTAIQGRLAKRLGSSLKSAIGKDAIGERVGGSMEENPIRPQNRLSALNRGEKQFAKTIGF